MGISDAEVKNKIFVLSVPALRLTVQLISVW